MATRAAWAIAVAITVGLIATAAHVERWLGGGRAPRLTFGVTVPPGDGDPLERVRPAWSGRLRGRVPAIARAGADRLTVTIDGVRAEADALVDVLTRPGRLEMYVGVHDTPTARAWYERVGRERDGAVVHGVADHWSHEPSGTELDDFYLRGPTAADLDAALAGLDPAPPDLRVLYELVEPARPLESDDLDPARLRPYVRTHLAEREPWPAGTFIKRAELTYDQYTNRPEVLVTFTRAGGQQFGELTSRMIGKKLLIVLDGVVTSAPIVQSAIRGGVTTITMGGADPRDQEAEARTLVEVLGNGAALPDGMEAALVEARAGAAGLRWPPRLALALLAGLLVFAGAAPLARRLTVATAAPRAPGTRGLARVTVAAVVTVGVPLGLLWIAPRLPLPGTNAAVLGDVLARGGGGDADLGRFSVLALGVMSVINGYWLVELWAALHPRWRERRTGTPGDRRNLDRAALAAGLVFATIQAFLLALYLQRVGGGVELVDAGVGARALIALSLVAGVAVHVVAADLVSRHGLCNGYVALVAVGGARFLVEAVLEAPRAGLPDQRVAFVATLLTVALPVLFAASLRDATPARRRLPWIGVVPVLALGVVAVLVDLFFQGLRVIDLDSGNVRWLEQLLLPSPWLDVGVAAVFAALLLRARGRDVYRASPTGLAISLAAIASIVLVRQLAPSYVFVNAWIVPVIAITALVADGLAAARARLGLADPVVVLAVHDVDRADRAADALAAAGIPASVENLRLRAILRGLAPFAPIVIRVDAAQAEHAATLVAYAEADRDPRVAAF